MIETIHSMKNRISESAVDVCLLVIMMSCLAVERTEAESYTFTPIDFPGAAVVDATGINDRGQIVGNYLDATGFQHGLLATDPPGAGIWIVAPVPEPASVILLASGFAGLAGWRFRK